MAHDSIQTVNFSARFCLVSTVDFLYMFYCITVCVMNLEPATEINGIELNKSYKTSFCSRLIAMFSRNENTEMYPFSRLTKAQYRPCIFSCNINK